MSDARTRCNKKYPKFADTHANFGPGMFLDARANTSTIAARRAVLRYVKSIGKVSTLPNRRRCWRETRVELLQVARHYWADHDYDERMKRKEIRHETRLFQRRLVRFREGLKLLPRHVAVALDKAVSRSDWEATADERAAGSFKTAIALVAKLETASENILRVSGKKERDLRIERACHRLWKLVEKSTGREFTRTWTICNTPPGLINAWGSRQFDKPDALFVQVVICAIDPRVKLNAIRDGLKRVAAEKNVHPKMTAVST